MEDVVKWLFLAMAVFIFMVSMSCKARAMKECRALGMSTGACFTVVFR